MIFKSAKITFFLIFFLFLGCGKNLTQTLFHPDIEKRSKESLSGVTAIPSPFPLLHQNSFRFAVFGDVQIRAENKNMLELFKNEVTHRNIDFFVVLGDLTEDGSNQELGQIKSDLNQVGIPYYATIGNHDLFQSAPAGGWESWKTIFGAATYSVILGGSVRLILLDTASGDIGATQFQWLENQLKIPVPFTLVGSHYPVNDGSTPSIWRLESTEERYKLTGLLNHYGVYAYLGGHVHGYREGKAGNILHLTIGSMYPYTLDFGTRGYVLFQYQQGQLSWQRIDLSE